MDESDASLTIAQRRAIEHVRGIALRSAAPSARQERYLAELQEHARVTLSFHPDRLASSGLSVAESFCMSGHYKSQFETGISNGSVSAFDGGERDEWERRLFGAAYHRPPTAASERPKYGALNLLDHAFGASPRFGSCYLRLRPHVLGRCTFTFGDSHLGPQHVSTLDRFEVILHALLGSVESTGQVLGEQCTTVDEAWRLLATRIGQPRAVTRDAPRNLDDYIEAQIHGDVRFDGDAEALVVDPSFRGSSTGTSLERLAAASGMTLEWHRGFSLSPGTLNAEFRGPHMRPLAEELCRRFDADEVDAALIGKGATSAASEPEKWTEWGGSAEVLQLLKKLWHCLYRFGDAPIAAEP